MNENEKKIKENRVIEASRKKLSGPDGKLMAVIHSMGQPIVLHNQGDTFYNSSYLDDPLKISDKKNNFELHGTPEQIQNQISYSDGSHDEPSGGAWRNERTYEKSPYTPLNLGWHFDGLSRGMHLEIKYLEDESKLTVHYKGYLVFLETAGDLKSFVPNTEWEDCIDKLYQVAQKVIKSRKQNKEKEKNNKAEKNKMNWLKRMQKLWGI